MGVAGREANKKAPVARGLVELLAESGFEPTEGLTLRRFQDRCLKPLGHLSNRVPVAREAAYSRT